MHIPSSVRIAAFAATLAGVVAWDGVRADPGALMSHTKISSTHGGFTGTLDNLDEFGGAVASLGDLDGAGPSVATVAVGTPGDDDGGSARGAVHMLFLNSAGSVLSSQKISDLAGGFNEVLLSGDEFGGSVAGLGDLDGAGPSVAALAVGSPGDDNGGSSRGAVYILFLSSSGTVVSAQKISDTRGNFLEVLDDFDEFGGAIAFLGDLDGAGPSAAAIAVGAVGDDDGGAARGAVYVLFLDATGTVLSSRKMSDTAGNFSESMSDSDELGGALAALGDLDGAGPSVAALCAGAPGDDDGGSGRGALYVLFLDAGGNVLSHQKISDLAGGFADPLINYDEFGGALADLGDLDGGGSSVATLAVGAQGDDGGGLDRGAVYLLFLGANGGVLSSRKISGTTAGFGGLADGDEFAGALASLGDLDGPGGSTRTLIAGAIGTDDGGVDRGAVRVLFLDGVATTGVLDPRGAAATHRFGPAHPNPFRLETSVSFHVGSHAWVELDVIDVTGRRVRRLFADRVGPGARRDQWDGRDDLGRPVPAGTYFSTMSVDGRRVPGAPNVVLLK